MYIYTRATRQCLRSRFYEAACAASNERAPRPRRGHPGRSAKRRERKSRPRSIVAGTGDPIVKQLYNYRGLVINCQPFQRLPRLQSSSCCALALTPRPRAINSLTFHRQTYLPVKLNGRRIRDYLLNQFPKTAIVEARAPPPLPSHSSPLSRLSRCASLINASFQKKTEMDGNFSISWNFLGKFFPVFYFFLSFFFLLVVVWNLFDDARGRRASRRFRGGGVEREGEWEVEVGGVVWKRANIGVGNR